MNMAMRKNTCPTLFSPNLSFIPVDLRYGPEGVCMCAIGTTRSKVMPNIPCETTAETEPRANLRFAAGAKTVVAPKITGAP